MEVGAGDKDKTLDIGQVRRCDIYVQCALFKSCIGKNDSLFFLLKSKNTFIKKELYRGGI